MMSLSINFLSGGGERMKIFISGSISKEIEKEKTTEVELGYKDKFKLAELYLESKGHQVMNPTVLPYGFSHEDYMNICYEMIKACDMVVFLRGNEDSIGSKMERDFANENKIKTCTLDQMIVYHAISQLEDLREEKLGDVKAVLRNKDIDPKEVYIHDFLSLDWALNDLKKRYLLTDNGGA